MQMATQKICTKNVKFMYDKWKEVYIPKLTVVKLLNFSLLRSFYSRFLFIINILMFKCIFNNMPFLPRIPDFLGFVDRA